MSWWICVVTKAQLPNTFLTKYYCRCHSLDIAQCFVALVATNRSIMILLAEAINSAIELILITVATIFQFKFLLVDSRLLPFCRNFFLF